MIMCKRTLVSDNPALFSLDEGYLIELNLIPDTCVALWSFLNIKPHTWRPL